MDFSIAGLANKYAIQQFPAAQGQENNPQIVQARNRHAFNWKVTAFNLASVVLISCVALSVLVSFKLFFLIGAAAFLARRSIMKDLTVGDVEPNNLAYKDILRESFGIGAGEVVEWNKYNPVKFNITGYHIFMGGLLSPLLPVVPAQANAAQAPAQAQPVAPAPDQANAAQAPAPEQPEDQAPDQANAVQAPAPEQPEDQAPDQANAAQAPAPEQPEDQAQPQPNPAQNAAA